MNNDNPDASCGYEVGCMYRFEDKPENAEAGYNAGLRCLLLEHGHNMHHYHPDIRLVKNWREIFEIVTK